MNPMTSKRPTPSGRASRELTPKQRVFALEYLNCWNASEAYRRAGYSPKNADVDGPKLLGNPGIAAFVAERERRILSRLELNAERVLIELHHLGLARLTRTLGPDGSPLPLEQWPEAERAALTKLEVKEILADRVMADTGETKSVVVGRVFKARMDSKLGALNTLAEIHGLVKPRDGGTASMRLEELILLARKTLELERASKAAGGAPRLTSTSVPKIG